MKTTFIVFKNKEHMIYHIWKSNQENWKQNVSVVNALSKAKYSTKGTYSAQPTASTSFYRYMLTTLGKGWETEAFEYDNIDTNTAKNELQELHSLYQSDEYKCISDEKFRELSGKYAGKKYKEMLTANLTLKRAKEWAKKLLESCLVDYDDSDITKVAIRAIMPKYELHNLSQWWAWVYEEYTK